MEFLKFSLLCNESGMIHFVSTRKGGISEGKYATLNLSLKVNDTPGNVLENRAKLASCFSFNQDKMIFPDQCHTNHIIEVSKSIMPTDFTKTDGLITSEKGICLCILTADCVPVLLYDPVKHVIAALHAGWRGTCGQIVSGAVENMISKYGCKPEAILACIGPAISQLHYEVGNEVSADFRQLFNDDTGVILRNAKTGKDHIDLKAANRILLLRSGLREEHIETSSLCTYENSGQLFSARRDGVECGRFATGIMLV